MIQLLAHERQLEAAKTEALVFAAISPYMKEGGSHALEALKLYEEMVFPWETSTPNPQDVKQERDSAVDLFRELVASGELKADES